MNLLPQNSRLGQLNMLEVFIEYEHPRLFSVVNNLGDIFLVLHIEESHNQDKWLYVPMDKLALKMIRGGAITLREGFVIHGAELCYIVTTNWEAESISIENTNIQLVDESVLPEKSISLGLDTPTQGQIDMYKELREAKGVTNGSMILRFSKEGDQTSTIDFGDLGKVAISCNELWKAIIMGNADENLEKKNLLSRSKLVVEKSMAGSFAIKVSNYSGALFDIFFQDTTRLFLELLDPQKLSEIRERIKSTESNNTAIKLKKLLLFLKKNKYTLGVDTINDENQYLQNKLSPEGSLQIYNAVQQEMEPEVIDTNIIDCKGKLHGIHLDNKTFKFVGSDGVEYEGKIAEESIQDEYIQSAQVKKRYVGQIMVERRKKNNVDEIIYTLTAISEEIESAS